MKLLQYHLKLDDANFCLHADSGMLLGQYGRGGERREKRGKREREERKNVQNVEAVYTACVVSPGRSPVPVAGAQCHGFLLVTSL